MVAEVEAQGGQVSFRDYMELALYHPVHGYYSSDVPRYGRRGDYMTAPSASSWYADVLAAWLARFAGTRGPVMLMDCGSGDGSCIDHLLSAHTRTTEPWLREVVSIERSESMRMRQEERFRDSAVTVRVVSPSEGVAPGAPFVAHASELYDAMPVHRVVARGGQLRELWIAVAAGGLEWRERPAPAEVISYFSGHGVALMDGQIAEANLGATPFHRRLLEHAESEGLAVVLDYGYESRRLYDARGRRDGSLACYREHRMGRDPLLAPGEQDLTAHVNWDDLRQAASEVGWREVGLWPLAEFLVRAGLEGVLESRGLGVKADLDAQTLEARQEIKRLLDPDGMGSDLKVLVQGRGDIFDVARELLRLPNDGETSRVRILSS
jgi:SAM-dependent MidA family methyltransferase